MGPSHTYSFSFIWLVDCDSMLCIAMTLLGSQSSHAGYLDINSHASTPTLRSNDCQVFLAPNKRSNTIRCSACSNYRSLLIVQCQRLNSKSSQDCSAHSSHINYRYESIINVHNNVHVVNLA